MPAGVFPGLDGGLDLLKLGLADRTVIDKERVQALRVDGIGRAFLLSPDQVTRGTAVELILLREEPFTDDGIQLPLQLIHAAVLTCQRLGHAVAQIEHQIAV